MLKVMTRAESNARIAALRARGYRVKRITLPDGSDVILKSRRKFVCSGHHHCVEPSRKRRRKKA